MKKLISSALLILILSSNAIAQSVAGKNNINQSSANDPTIPEELAELFDTDIFSLSKKSENAFDAASSIYVLSSEDIRRSGAANIPEALRLVPGLQVAQIDGNKWAISARGFNSQYSNKLLVMIDGRTVYTPLFSGSFWDVQDYLLADVEKIEVIRGSGGAIWGANAVNGIINIITKNSIDSQGGYASATIGNKGRKIASVRYGGATEDLNHYRIYAKQVYSGEEDQLDSNIGNDDGYRQSQAGFRYDIRSIQDNNIAIHGDIRSGQVDRYFQNLPTTRNSTKKDSKGANIVVNWEKNISKKSSFNLQSYLDYDQFDMQILSRVGKTADVDFQYFYDFSANNQLVLGAGYRLVSDSIGEELDSGSNTLLLDYEPNKRNDQIFSAFAQDKIGLISDILYLTLGSKFEHNTYTGKEFQPSAKLTYFPSRNQTAWASISKSIRTPTRGEDGLTLSAGGITQKGSSSYGAEDVTAYEAGYRIKPIRTTLVDIAIFYNDYDNLRTFNADGSGNAAVANNHGTGKSYGGEITLKWQASNNWRLEAGYDFLKLDVKNTGPQESAIFSIHPVEGQSPNNQFRLRSSYNITPKLEFDNIFYYVDSLPTAQASSDKEGVPSYTRFDTRLGYLFNSNLEFSVGIQNLTDEKHQEFNRGLFGNDTEIGRTYYFKTVVRFW